MNRFVIVDGLPFLLAHGSAYAVKWDEKGFTVGAEVHLASVPARTFSEISVRAKCAGHLDSMAAMTAAQEVKDDLDGMRVKELRAYALAHDVKLEGLTKKADILGAIRAVMAAW